MTAATAAEPGKIDIGRVISDTFKVLGRNFVIFALLSAVLVGLPSALLLGLQPFAADAAELRFGPGLFFGWLVAVVTGAILQGALVYGAVQDLGGRKPALGDIVATGLRSFLPIIAVSLLFGIAVVIGLILLVVPGIMIACAWCVAVPALVADRTSVFDSFRRSGELTRGNRWRIFGLFVIWLVAIVLLSGVVGLLGATIGSPLDVTPFAVIVNFLYATLSGLIGAAGTAVLYVELRRAREGLGPQWLAEIFG